MGVIHLQDVPNSSSYPNLNKETRSAGLRMEGPRAETRTNQKKGVNQYPRRTPKQYIGLERPVLRPRKQLDKLDMWLSWGLDS